MRSILFFLSVLLLMKLSYGKILLLNVEYMDSFTNQINVRDPWWGSSSSGILKSHFGSSYASGKNKTLLLSAPIGYSMLAAIKFVDFRPSRQDTLTLFDYKEQVRPLQLTNFYSVRRKMYFPQEEKTFFAPSGQLGVTFTTGPYRSVNQYQGFELTYTVQAGPLKCNRDDFRCTNGRCIASILPCDGHNHCGDLSSENNCRSDNFKLPSSGRIAGIISGTIFFMIAVACIIFIVIRRAARDKTRAQGVITHPPPMNPSDYPPAYPQPGTYYPPPPPPYSEGVTNPGFR